MSVEAQRIIGLYQRVGLLWERKRGRRKPLFEKPWLDRFTALLAPCPTILDLGCGAGEPLAGHMIESGCAVTGVDTSPALLELSRSRFPAQDWILADMRGLDLGRQFNGILAWNSFFHLCHDDQRGMFPVFRRHAAPRAALMFTSGPSHGEAIGSLEGEPLYHASLEGDEYRALLGENGFRVVAHMAEDPECNRHTVWLAQAE